MKTKLYGLLHCTLHHTAVKQLKLKKKQQQLMKINNETWLCQKRVTVS